MLCSVMKMRMKIPVGEDQTSSLILKRGWGLVLILIADKLKFDTYLKIM